MLTPDEAQRLIEKDPKNKDVLFPYLNGDDLNNSPDQSPSRWVINFFDWTEEKAQHYPDCFDIVERLVKPQRIKMKGDRGAKYWWQFLRVRNELYRTIGPLERVLVITRVSKYVNIVYVPSKIVFMDKVVVLAFQNDKYLTLLQSSIYDYWAWKYSSTLGGGTINFSPNDCFETFTFPHSITTETNAILDQIGETYHEHRRQLMHSLQIGLTKTYNLFHKKELSINDIEKVSKQPTPVCEKGHKDILKLRELHVEMDNAVLYAYGWTDLKLTHDFYEVDYLPENDRIRYTISPEARKEVLKRLLLLNHEIYNQEVAQGLHDKKNKTQKIKVIETVREQTQLFETEHKPEQPVTEILKVAEDKKPYQPTNPSITSTKTSPNKNDKVPTDPNTWLRLSNWVKDEMKIYTGWADFALEISSTLKKGSKPTDKQKSKMKQCWGQAMKRGFDK